MTEAAQSVDAEYVIPEDLTSDLEAISSDEEAPILSVSVNQQEPLRTNSVSLTLVYSDNQTGVTGYFVTTDPNSLKTLWR